MSAGATSTAILFTDLVDSTRVLSLLGDAAGAQLFEDHFRLVEGSVQTFGGRVLKGTGDGVMATFPDPTSAVATAAAVQNEVVLAEDPPAMQVRIGISAGEVVWTERDCFGRAVVEAARLCDAADPGQILVAGPAASEVRLQTMQCVPRGARALKGLPDPVPVAEVVGGIVTPDAPPLADVVSSTHSGAIESRRNLPFCGRAAEMRDLEDAWMSGTRLVLVDGEPGIGKTRLLGEFARHVLVRGGLVFWGACHEAIGAPYEPFLEVLAAYEGDLGPGAAELERLTAGSAPVPSETPAAAASDPDLAKYLLFQAFAQWMATVSEDTPTLLAIDDLHWATSPTLQLVRHIALSALPRNLQVACTYRSTERAKPLDAFVADMVRQLPEGHHRMRLGGLVPDDIASHSGGSQTAERLIALTGGNAFFVAELLRRVGEGHTWDPAEDAAIPDSIRDVVRAEVARLPQPVIDALALTAAHGGEVDSDLLGVEHLDEAVGAGLVVELGPHRYRMAHELVRATLYDDMILSHRARLHRRLAVALADRETPAAELARHWQEAGDRPETLRWMRRAGDAALERLAPEEAAEFYSAALDVSDANDARCDLMTLLGIAQRQGGDPAHRHTLLDAARLAREIGDAERLADAAIANTRWIGLVWQPPDHEVVTDLGDARHALSADRPELCEKRALVAGNLAVELTFSAPLAERRALTDEALELIESVGAGRALAQVLNSTYIATWHASTLDERSKLVERLGGVAAMSGDPVLERARVMLEYDVAMEVGDAATARDLLADLRSIAADESEPAFRWIAGNFEVGDLIFQGRIVEAEQRAADVLELGQVAGQPQALVVYAVQLVNIRRWQGRSEELIPVLETMLAGPDSAPGARMILASIYAETGRLAAAGEQLQIIAADDFAGVHDDWTWLATMCAMTDVARRTGDAQRSAALCDHLEPYRHMVAYAGAVTAGPVVWFLGHGWAGAGETGRAEECFRAAVSAAERLGAAGIAAHARYDLAELLLEAGDERKRSEASGLLDTAAARADDLGLDGLRRLCAQAR